jgi:hypothetical protein
MHSHHKPTDDCTHLSGDVVSNFRLILHSCNFVAVASAASPFLAVPWVYLPFLFLILLTNLICMYVCM